MPRLPLILLLLGLAGGAARAAEPEPLEQIRDAATAYVSARLGGGAQLGAAPLDPRIRVPACGGPLQTGGTAPNPGNAWSVAVHCAGPSVWTLYVPVRASERRTVVVVKRSLAPGLPVPADALALQEQDTAGLPNGYIARIEDAAGKLLRRPVTPGEPLPPNALDAPASIRRGQEIVLMSQAGGFVVRASGKALADGASGERIKAENLDTHRQVEGVVREDGVLEIGM
jgi:flagella basal body P-ring formation protein FlgA